MDSNVGTSGCPTDFVSTITAQAENGYIDAKGYNISDDEFTPLLFLIKRYSVTRFFAVALLWKYAKCVGREIFFRKFLFSARLESGYTARLKKNGRKMRWKKRRNA